MITHVCAHLLEYPIQPQHFFVKKGIKLLDKQCYLYCTLYTAPLALPPWGWDVREEEPPTLLPLTPLALPRAKGRDTGLVSNQSTVTRPITAGVTVCRRKIICSEK